MCDPISITAVAVITTAGVTKAVGQKAEGEATANMYEYQAALARQNQVLVQQQRDAQVSAIEDTAQSNITATQDVAALESNRLSRSVAELSGTQRATIGALGIGGVTAADIVKSSFDKANLDQLALRYNANVKSYQIREQAKQSAFSTKQAAESKIFALGSEASQYGFAASNARTTGKRKMWNTLLSTASTVAFMGVNAGGGMTPFAASGNKVPQNFVSKGVTV